MKKITKLFALLLVGALLTGILASCGSGGTSSSGGSVPAAAMAAPDEGGAVVDDGRKYTIGVIPFSDTAAEQIEWNNYLEDYLGPAFNIEFKFVPAPGTDAEAAVTAVEELKLAGVQGILGIIDAPAAIEKANELEVWYVRGGGLSVTADYEAVKNLPYYLGTMGPALDDEFDAANSAAKFFLESGAKNILAYGYLLGLNIPSDMHIQRFEGMVAALEEAGAEYTPPSGNLVTGPGVGEFAPGTSGLEITTIYGMINFAAMDPTFNERLTQAASGKTFDAVLIGAEGSQDVNTLLTGMGINGAKMSEVGAFTPIAKASFEAGILNYLVGKYPSSMGPSVAALMNAIDGNADIIKNADGTGSRLQGPFWTASSIEEFNEKMALDDLTNPAFNRALMEQYVKRLNPDVTRESFAEFAGLGYDELKARHQ